MSRNLILPSTIIAALGFPSSALANGGDLHVGGVGIGVPPVILWISGAGLALVFLMLLGGWAMSYRSLQRRRRDQANSNETVKEAYDPDE